MMPGTLMSIPKLLYDSSECENIIPRDLCVYSQDRDSLGILIDHPPHQCSWVCVSVLASLFPCFPFPAPRVSLFQALNDEKCLGFVELVLFCSYFSLLCSKISNLRPRLSTL